MASSRNSRSSSLADGVAAALQPVVHPGAHLVIGLSGGVDSVTLLAILAEYKTISINEEEPTLVDVFIRLTQSELPFTGLESTGTEATPAEEGETDEDEAK